MRIRAFGDFRRKLGHEFEVKMAEGSRLADLLEELEMRMGYPGTLLDPSRNIAASVTVFLDGLAAQLLGGSAAELKDGSVVSLLHPSAGG